MRVRFQSYYFRWWLQRHHHFMIWLTFSHHLSLVYLNTPFQMVALRIQKFGLITEFPINIGIRYSTNLWTSSAIKRSRKRKWNNQFSSCKQEENEYNFSARATWSLVFTKTLQVNPALLCAILSYIKQRDSSDQHTKPFFFFQVHSWLYSYSSFYHLYPV